MSPLQFGYLIGIIYGLYFESIVLFYVVLYLLVLLIKMVGIPNWKFLRYLKIFIKRKIVILIVGASIIGNIHITHVNNRYDAFHANIGDTIEFIGVVISEPTPREHTYRYIIQGIHGRYRNKRFLMYVRKDRVYNVVLEYGDLIKVSRRFCDSQWTEEL